MGDCRIAQILKFAHHRKRISVKRRRAQDQDLCRIFTKFLGDGSDRKIASDQNIVGLIYFDRNGANHSYLSQRAKDLLDDFLRWTSIRLNSYRRDLAEIVFSLFPQLFEAFFRVSREEWTCRSRGAPKQLAQFSFDVDHTPTAQSFTCTRTDKRAASQRQNTWKLKGLSNDLFFDCAESGLAVAGKYLGNTPPLATFNE